MSDVVSTSATTQPVTLDDVKLHLNISSTLDDATINSEIAAATQFAENQTNRRFITETRVLKMNGFEDPRYVHDRVIHVPKSPLASVSSVVYEATDGTTTTLGTTAYGVSTGDIPGRVFEKYNEVWPVPRDVPNSVTVTYTCGYGSTQSAVPENVKQAIRLTVGHLYRNREAVSDVKLTNVPMSVEALLSNEMVPDYG